jgi:CheY-like chemotaxis protein
MLQKSVPPETTETQLEQARRMEIVGRLTGGVVHDFNNILTVISGTIEILAEAVADRAELAAIAGLISEAAARGAHLTSTLLAFARGGQPSHPRDVDVNTLIVDAARLLRPTLGEHIEIDALRTTEACVAFVDPNLLTTALLHLAVIARDAMPDGGKLVFESRDVISGDGIPAVADGMTAADHVMIAVHISGHGASIAPGRGFSGLDGIIDLIRQSSGHIDLRSDGVRGTAVRMYLPRPSGRTEPLPEDCGEGGDEAILIVEDDALVRRYVVAQIRSLGYRTLAASNGSEALAIIDNGDEIDLLFTDVVMPGAINGRQLAVEALERRPSLKVLYTSGYARNAMVQGGHPGADVLLLAKPYRKADLAKMIRSALAA